MRLIQFLCCSFFLLTVAACVNADERVGLNDENPVTSIGPPLAYLPLENGEVVEVISGRRPTVMSCGWTTDGEGRASGALQCTGDDYVRLDDLPALGFGAGREFAVALRLRPHWATIADDPEYTLRVPLMQGLDNISFVVGIARHPDPDSLVILGGQFSGSDLCDQGPPFVGGSVSVSRGSGHYHQIILQRRISNGESVLELFFDGTLAGFIVPPLPEPYCEVGGTSELYIGRPPSFNARNYAGDLSEVVVYGQALTPAQVERLTR